MLKGLGKITNNDIVNKTKTSIDSKYNNQNKSNPKQKSSEIVNYMRKKEKNGISLYTHVRCLLDMFIFQNPMQPVTYFEYYSEQLKKYYHISQPNPDLDFLNNIDQKVYCKITDLYKDTIVQNLEYPILEDKTTNNISYGEENFGYGEENEDEDHIKNDVKFNNVILQDLSQINYMFNKAGCGITIDETNLIKITIVQMSRLGKFKNIRYWGKILGLQRNYYVLECEWHDEEIENKLWLQNMNNNISDLDDYYNLNENEEQVELEKYILSMGSNEHVEEEKEVNEASIHASEFNESQKSKPLCSFPSTESNTNGYLAHEIFGFGSNRKSYFVTNQLNDEWVELPLLKPHYITQSRNIKRYFVGDLESRVESYPRFQGLEKHYLRAQIARITAATQISPHDYFVPGGNKSRFRKWRKLNDFQSSVLSWKWVHDYEPNQNYIPLSEYDLLNPSNWVHHIPLISNKGITKAWAKFKLPENYKVNDFFKLTIDDYDDGDSDLFSNLSDDVYMGVVPWKIETTNPFDHKASLVVVKSNIWPGAFAVTRDNFLDNTYYGWGQKWSGSFPSIVLNEYQLEHPNGADEIIEFKDPTQADELAFFENVKQMKEEKKKMKIAANNRLARKISDGDNEEEERIINQYDYI